MQTLTPNFRSILATRLESRRRTNPTFSIRAFARQLQISHTLLSNVLSGKKGISLEMAEKLSERLSLTEVEEKRFLVMVLSENTSSNSLKSLFSDTLSRLGDLPENELR
jgi:uncharacterized protein (TIGR02147 family)